MHYLYFFSHALRYGALSIALAIFAWSATSRAQTSAPQPPPLYSAIDEHGVNLATGEPAVSAGALSIGDAKAPALSYTYFATSRGVENGTPFGTIHNTDRYLVKWVVSFGTRSERFLGGQSSLSPVVNTGSTLVFDSGTNSYVYTMRDGTVAVYSQTLYGYFPLAGSRGNLVSVTYPAGEKLTYTYETIPCPSGQTPGAVNSCPKQRPRSVMSNTGYQMRFEYADSKFPARVVLSNMATDYCDPNAAACAYTQDWPNVTFPTTSVTAKDGLGRLTTHTTNEYTRTISKPSGGSLTFTYQNGVGPCPLDSTNLALPKVTSVSDGTRTWTYAYSGYNACDASVPGLTATVTDLQGHQRTTSFDQDGLPAYVKDELDKTTTYTRSGAKITRATFPEGNYVAYEYDARGNLTKTTQVAKPGSAEPNIVTLASYETSCSNRKTCNKPNYTIDPRGSRTDFTYDPNHGGILTETSPAPKSGAARPQTRYSYTALYARYKDSNGQVVQAATPVYKLTGISSCKTGELCIGTAEEFRTIIEYGPATGVNNLLPTKVVESSGDNVLLRATGTSYDSVGNVIASDGPLPGPDDTTRYRYDIARQRIGAVGPDPDGTGPLKHRAERYTYNGDGFRIALEKGAVNSQSDNDWAAMSALEARYAPHDGTGRMMQETLVSGGVTHITTQFSYNSDGRIECIAKRMNPGSFVTLPSSACTLGTAGVFGPDRIKRTLYDAANRTIESQSGYGTSVQRSDYRYTYTDNGRVETVLDAKGNLTTYIEDGHDRLRKTLFPSKTIAGQSSNVDYEELGYDLNSKIASKRLRSGQIIYYANDFLSRVSVKDLPGTTSEDVYYSYDNLGRPISAVLGNGSGISNFYDALGRKTSTLSHGRTLEYQYDDAGNRTRITHPDGYYVTYAYNKASDLTVLEENGTFTLASFAYDDLGRVTGRGNGSGSSIGFGYDGAGRLSVLNNNLDLTAYDSNVALSHSPASQIVTKTQTNDALYHWTPSTSKSVIAGHNGLNQVANIDGLAVVHDGLGNLTTGAPASTAPWTFGYDNENRLRTASSGANIVSLTYDPSGLLNTVNSNGTLTTFLYDGDALVSEYNSAGAVLSRYVHATSADSPLVQYSGASYTSSNRRYLHTDERGSIIAVSNSTGAGTASTKYSPFGESSNSSLSRFGFTGQLWLPEVGLNYYKARVYSPRLGRFLQPDPIGYGPDLNLYAYVQNDPINGTDSTGNCPACIGFALGAALEVARLGFTGGLTADTSVSGIARTVGKVSIAALAGATGAGLGANVARVVAAARIGGGTVAATSGATASANIAGGAAGGFAGGAVTSGSNEVGQQLLESGSISDSSAVASATVEGAVMGAAFGTVASALGEAATVGNAARQVSSMNQQGQALEASGVLQAPASNASAAFSATIETVTSTVSTVISGCGGLSIASGCKK